jgi:hypothetical protein
MGAETINNFDPLHDTIELASGRAWQRCPLALRLPAIPG